MPQHKGPIQKLVDPFSIPAQMNNLGVLVVAYVTMSMHDKDKCIDPHNQEFLQFIYYGSTIVCVGTFLMSIFYMLGAIDFCINKIMPCGEVCLTLNTLTVFLIGILYHCIATLYGLEEMLFGQTSQCVELEMFKRITCTIYVIWFVFIVAYVIFNLCFLNRRKSPTNANDDFVQF